MDFAYARGRMLNCSGYRRGDCAACIEALHHNRVGLPNVSMLTVVITTTSAIRRQANMKRQLRWVSPVTYVSEASGDLLRGLREQAILSTGVPAPS